MGNPIKDNNRLNMTLTTVSVNGDTTIDPGRYSRTVKQT
jgi:hypothetical protein